MESDLYQHHLFLGPGHHHLQQNHQKQMNSGLTRYQSAPSSYLSSFLDKEFCEEILGRPSSPETQGILETFLANSDSNMNNFPNQNLQEIKSETPVVESVAQVNQQQQQMKQSNYSSVSKNYCQNQSRPPLPEQDLASAVDYGVVTSMGMARLPQMKSGGENNSGLVRHSSSPAGLFANINIELENGYPVMKAMGEFSAAGNVQASYSAASRAPSAAGPLSSIAEIGTKNMAENNPASGGFGETHIQNYGRGHVQSWEDSAAMSAPAKGLTNEDRTLSGPIPSQSQSGETGNHPPMLAHHLSLPKTSAEMATVGNLLQLQDSVPWKTRAKRGCATHPRSIAERVRRTKISERMRKLQDLVPNMDKQTNTADMLDLAVNYIKDLQTKVNTLSENRAKCTCKHLRQQQ